MHRNNFSCLLALLTSCVFWAGPLSAQDQISFTKHIKPILDSKCISCHACYEAPAQLDLRNAAGVQRGAIKLEAYLARLEAVSPTRIWDSPNTIDDWRKRGFFSVTEGGENSIMGKMLALGQKNPVRANDRFPTNIEIDPMRRKPVIAQLARDGELRGRTPA